MLALQVRACPTPWQAGHHSLTQLTSHDGAPLKAKAASAHMYPVDAACVDNTCAAQVSSGDRWTCWVNSKLRPRLAWLRRAWRRALGCERYFLLW